MTFKSIHPFPARMAPSIVLDELRNEKQKLTIVDPMVGSGTSIVAARLQGHEAIGFDVDPLAVLIARTWAADIIESEVRRASENALKSARKFVGDICQGNAYPVEADDETRKFLRFWFDPYSRRQLTALCRAIEGCSNRRLRDVLWCGLSRMVITKSDGVSLAMDVSHSRPHKVYTRSPRRPFEQFPEEIERIVRSAPFKTSTGGFPRARVFRGDARKMWLPSESVDLVITSPPYLNAIDYLRGHRLALAWMGHQVSSLRRVRSQAIGSENALCSPAMIPILPRLSGYSKNTQPRLRGMLLKYAADMFEALSEVKRILKPGGRLLLVIGNSTTHGTFINTSGLIQALAGSLGLKLTSARSRVLPDSRRYLPPPNATDAGSSLRKRMRTEVVLKFERHHET